jgi:hypothetical protein
MVKDKPEGWNEINLAWKVVQEVKLFQAGG